MSYVDLHATLRDWPFEPDQISVRKILGTDGVVRIQMRIELGIQQMEVDGRPDGLKPYGRESILAYHRQRLAEHEEQSGPLFGFHLSPEECCQLRSETSLYYRRYVAEFVLEEYAAVYRDTAHNLEVFDLCRDYAVDPEDRTYLEGFRPYVLMMDARARAYAAEQEGEVASGIAHVNRGIMHIKSHFEQRGVPEAIERCEEIRVLQALGAELAQAIPQDTLLVTRKALRDAIEHERFEEAAELRDALKKLEQRKG